MTDSVGKLHINLSAVQNNWSLIAQQVDANVTVAAVVKANGYGLGVDAIVSALWMRGCRTFFVASLAEAEVLYRLFSDAGFLRSGVSIGAPFAIYMLSGASPDCFAQCAQRGFIPVLYSLSQIRAWETFNRTQHKAYPCAIKIDTGMHRLGLTESECRDLLNQPDVLVAAAPRLLMSHLACADTPEHPLNEQQLQRFQDYAERFKTIVPHLQCSLANSSGVFLGKRYHFDMVRPGYSLYGGNPQPELANVMAPVVSLELPIAQVKQIDGPASVGYGATFSIPEGEARRIAIVLGGYADGVMRHLSNQGCGKVAGCRVPVVGRVSMDSTIFDVTAVADIEHHSSITLMGEDNLVDSLARAAGTIGYEILTRLGSRYERCYLHDGINLGNNFRLSSASVEKNSNGKY